jgi:hypothetical protein
LDTRPENETGQWDRAKSDVILPKSNFWKAELCHFRGRVRKEKSCRGDFSLSPNEVLGNKIIKNFSGKSTGMLDYSFLSSIGSTEQVPVASFDAAIDDEVTACRLQGMMFHDEELGWCTVTNWGVEYGTTFLFYSPVTLSNPVEEEHHASLAEVLTWIRDSPVMPRLSAYRSS